MKKSLKVCYKNWENRKLKKKEERIEKQTILEEERLRT